jgi:hypothetical protein
MAIQHNHLLKTFPIAVVHDRTDQVTQRPAFPCNLGVWVTPLERGGGLIIHRKRNQLDAVINKRLWKLNNHLPVFYINKLSLDLHGMLSMASGELTFNRSNPPGQ